MSAKSQYRDEVKSLRRDEVKQERQEFLNEPHVAQLVQFVDELRDKKSREQPSDLDKEHIPYFDPLDGGIEARCLFLFEAPGGKAVESGFISRNNPDESAKKFFELNERAGLDRTRTVSWNIVPWYLGDGKRIRAAKARDIKEGLDHLWPLLKLLKNIQVVVLGGLKAQRAKSVVQNRYPNIRVTDMWHPSPQSLNRVPKRRDEILETLREVSREIS